jgi:excisionase family DNA binding protein
MQHLMTIKEVASYLRLKNSTLYKLAQTGRVPASKIGGPWRFSKEMLDDWLTIQPRLVRGKVLVVDDDARVRDILQDVIIGQGYQVVATENVERAIEEMEKQHFGLVFLDLVLPGLSGIEVLRWLKAKGEKAVVAIVTGYGDDPIALEAMEMGPLLLIRKPFRVEDVVEVLNIVMNARR